VEALDFTFFFFAVLCHKTLVADVGDEEAFGDGDVGGVLVGGGVGGAFIGIPFSTYVGITALPLIVSLLFLPLSLLIIVPVTVSRNRTFCYKVTGLTTLVANLLGTGFVVSPLPLLEDIFLESA
jgi:hypothetical protein